MKVLHVTEAMAAGVLSSIERIVEKQAALGAEITVAYLTRWDSPSEADLRSRFPGDVHLHSLDTGSRPRDLFALARFVHAESRSGAWDAIHLHSSKAGLVGRVAALGSRRASTVFYSPHGFAFLRQDLHPLVKCTATIVEAVMARAGGGLILVSPSELEVATSSLSAPRVHLVRNGIATNLATVPQVKQTRRPTVAMVGRVTYQKAPWRFAEVARELAGDARFRWLGAGEDDAVSDWLSNAPVELSGWLSRSKLMGELETVDILLFPSLWEGMPIALMEAQAMGIPAVASAIVGNVDVVVHDETGFLARSDEELLSMTRRLIDDSELRQRMSAEARRHAHANLSDTHIGSESLAVYRHSRKKKKKRS